MSNGSGRDADARIEERMAAPAKQTPEELQAEVERLRAENDRLKAGREHAGWGRMFAAWVLLVIGVLLLGLAVPAVWLNRTVTDTDNWVQTVAPLADDPVIQNAVADRATEALFAAIDVEEIARSVLPTAADILAAPIAGSARGFISDQAHALVESDQFKTVWVELNRIGHKTVLAAVTGREGVVTSQAGVISLDLGLLLEKVQQRLVDGGFSIAAKIPVQNIDKEIVLVRSTALEQAQTYVDLMDKGALWIPLLGLASVFGAIGIAPDRRKIVLWLGVGIVLVMLLPLEAIYLARYPLTNAAMNLGARSEAVPLAIYDTVFRGLIAAQRTGIVTGIVIWLAALIAGPAHWAVALRRGVQNGMQGIGSGWDFGAFGEWVLAHKAGLRTVGLVVAVVVFLAVQGKTPAFIIWLVVFVVLYLLLLEFLGRPSPPKGVEPGAGVADAAEATPAAPAGETEAVSAETVMGPEAPAQGSGRERQ